MQKNVPARVSACTRLTSTEALFCIAYVRSVSMDISEAAAAVGMSPHWGRNLLKSNADAVEYIDELVIARATRLLIDADTVVVELLENARHARKVNNIEASNNALLLLGRHFGMFPSDGGGGNGGNGTNIFFGAQLVGENAASKAKAININARELGGPSTSPDSVEGQENIIVTSEKVPRRADSPGRVLKPEDT